MSPILFKFIGGNMMLKRIIFVIILLFVSVLFLCVQKKQQIKPNVSFIIDKDTITQEKIELLDSDTISKEKKICRTAIKCALSKKACETKFSLEEKDFFNDLYNQLSLHSEEKFTPTSAASFYYAVKELNNKTKELKYGENIAKYLDSLVASLITIPDNKTRKQMVINDSILKNMGNIDSRQKIEKLISTILGISPKSSSVFLDFVLSQETTSKEIIDASSYVKGLVSDKNEAKQIDLKKKQISKEKNDEEVALRLQKALAYRTHQSISDSIKKHLPILEAIYKKQLKTEPNISGVVWVTFIINADGTVSQVKIKSSEINSKEFLNPFCDYIKKIRFLKIPQELGEMAFEFPFEFTQEQ